MRLKGAEPDAVAYDVGDAAWIRLEPGDFRHAFAEEGSAAITVTLGSVSLGVAPAP